MVIMAILMSWIVNLDGDHGNPNVMDCQPGWWSWQSLCHGLSYWMSPCMVIMAILMPWIVTLYGDHGNPYAIDCYPIWWSWQSLCHGLPPWTVFIAILMPRIFTLDGDHCNPYAMDFHPGGWSWQSLRHWLSPWMVICHGLIVTLGDDHNDIIDLMPWIVTLDNDHGNPNAMDCHPGWWSRQSLCHALST